VAFLFGDSSSNTQVKPAYTGLQLQTSVNTLPIPIIWGITKAAANVIWYANFQAIPVQTSSGGKGGGDSTTTSSYNYSADLILALCEGPIAGVLKVWKNQSIYNLGDIGLTLFTGTTPQAIWGYLQSNYPSQALAYQGTAYCAGANYQLGSSADIGNHNFEVAGVLQRSGINGTDADPAQVIYDFLTNAQYGAGFDPTKIDMSTLYGSGGDASLQTYCNAVGIAFSPCLSTQEQGSSILNRWLQVLNCAAVWSEGQLRFIPYGDAAVGAGSTVRSVQYAVPQVQLPADGSTPPPSQVIVCAPSLFISDGGVIYTRTGVALSPTGSFPPSSAGQYNVSGGVYTFNVGDQAQIVTITFTTNIPTSYTPNLTPIFNLDDRDFIDDGGDKDPIVVSRVDPFSLPTVVRVECLSRSNQYGGTPVEARDQSQIELYGTRVGPTVQAHEICDEVVIGRIVAQAILQRQLYVRAHFSFKLSWEYCILDPMDVLTLNDATLGLSNYAVRITTIEEDEKGILTITAEELTIGTSSAALYPNASPQGYQQNTAAFGGPVNPPPLIWEPPPAMTNNVQQVWVGASGGSGGVNNPRWGGANVFVSLDNTTYSQVGVINAPLRQGLLTAPLPAASGWDTTNTLSVNMAESAAALDGTSAASAQAGATQSLIDNELLSFETATLTATNQYNLTGLQRAMYGTPSASHATGAMFARLDTNSVFPYTLPANYIGKTLYFKFQSFNVLGGSVEDLSTVAVYTFTPVGAGSDHPIAAQLNTGMALDMGFVNVAPVVSDDFGAVYSAPVGNVDLGLA